MPSLSVIIRTYSEARWDYLLAAVRSVEQQTRPPEEIIVVVDHNPALYDRVRTELPGVIAVPNREATGLSGGGNSGIQAAKGEIVVFIDDDATASADWLEQLELGYRNPDVVGVGGAILPVWDGGQPKWFPDEFAWVVGCSYRGLPEVETSVRNLIGCNMSFRRLAFEAVGYFRGAEQGIGRVGTSPSGCEETEFCIRLRQQRPDKIMLYRPQASVHHHVPASRTKWKYFQSRCYLEGRSKAHVAQLVGSRDGLESERAHAIRTLPRGVVHGVRDFVLSGDTSGLARATAIIAGLGWAAVGYLAGTLSGGQTDQPRTSSAPGSTARGQTP